MPQSITNKLFTQVTNMELETSNKTSDFGPRPHIEEGFYNGRLVEVKPLEKEGKYGKMLLLLFEVFCDKYKEKEGKYPVLGKVVYHVYKTDDGDYRTAVTPKSAITKLFESLGWTFTGDKPLQTDEFIGCHAKVLVEDAEDKEGTKFSAINKVKQLDDAGEQESDVLLEDVSTQSN